MDKQTFLGFLLIGLVVMIWLWMNSPPPPKPGTQRDSTAVINGAQTATGMTTDSAHAASPVAEAAAVTGPDTLGKFFSQDAFHSATEEEKFVTIETDEYIARFSSKGGSLKSYVLKKFKTWAKYPVELINPESPGELNLLFYTSDGKLIDTRGLTFQSNVFDGRTITLAKGDSVTVDMSLSAATGGAPARVIKSFTFTGGVYGFDANFRFENMEGVLSNFEYQIIWETGLRYAERNSIDESNTAQAFAYSGGELTDIDAAKVTDNPKQTVTGAVKWVATRTKYFGMAIIADDNASNGAFLEGKRIAKENGGAEEYYSLGMKMPFMGKPVETGHVQIFLGPLDFTTVKHYDVELQKMMNLGWAWIIRPIAEYVMMPLFQAIHWVIPNWGLVIIVFSFIIKLALYPLTRSSMKSMKKMQALQPMMDEIREKHKDDPQKMNAAIMRLYKEYGVNPAGGCLPMILQMPILYALWAVFRSTIQLRQAPFFGWIHDLSVPDVVAHLPFPLPIFNITELSGLSLLMGITMFIQQKMSVKDPRQKAMVWMMPIMMTLIFNNFPSGLNLYYFVFNAVQIVQQLRINKQHDDKPLRKVEDKPNKGGIFAGLSKQMPKLNK
jgi:YidC/Oxa1 family membrane protein insertase